MMFPELYGHVDVVAVAQYPLIVTYPTVMIGNGFRVHVPCVGSVGIQS